MKRFIPILLFMLPVSLSAQLIKFKIAGTVKNVTHAKFAYLSSFYQQVTVSSPKIFMVSPIINGKFEFSNTFDLEGKDFQHACVIVDERGNISKEELASRFKQQSWIAGREKFIRVVLLENLKLDIPERDQTRTATVVAGGRLTKQLDEMGLAMREGNKKLVSFVEKYPDSPVTLLAVEQCSDTRGYNHDKLLKAWGSASELYSPLSERLKKTPRGIALKRDIEEQSKP
jgi:hypothetical protein